MSKKAMEQALDALEKWGATIQYQDSGSKAGASALQEAIFYGSIAIDVLKEAIKPQDEPFGYARFILDDVGDRHFHSFAKTTEGWNVTLCCSLYTSAPSSDA
jgi:hypothetical protein